MGLTRPRAHQLQDSDFKQSVRAVSTSNVTLSGGAPATLDGVSLSTNDRVLVTGQSTASQNGIYVVTTVGSGSNGTWARSIDADTTGDMTAGMVVMVTEGTSYEDTTWKITTNDPITLDTTSITFEQSSAYAFGTISANSTSIVADSVGDTVTFSPGDNIAITGNAASKIITISATGTSASIGELSDVTITSAADGEFLKYNGSAWVNAGLDNGSADVTLDTFTGDGSTTAFTVTTAPTAADDLIVTINGIVQRPTTDYTVSSTTLTMSSAPESGDVVASRLWSGVGSGGGADLTGNIDFGTDDTNTITFNGLVDSDIIPSANVTYNLGNATNRWQDLFLAGNTIDLGGAKIQTDTDSGAVAILPKPTANVANPKGIVFAGDGTVKPVETTAGVVSQANFTAAASSSAKTSAVAVYANVADIPVSNVSAGSQAFVTSNNNLYIHSGSGWFVIATVNQTPTISGNEASYILASDGTATTVTLTGTDPEGFAITWSAVTSGDTDAATVTNVDNVFTITPSTDSADAGTLTVTFRASDGVNIGTATSEFTLAFVSPYWDETVLSIGTSATNGLDNSTFIDRSTNAHTVTPTGSPFQTAFHPYLRNWSVEFDGSGDYLTVPYTTDFQLTADFTIEFWVNPTSRASTYNGIINNYSTYTSNGGFAIFAGHNGANTSKYNVAFNGSFPVIQSTSDISYGSWTHIALVRSGSTLSLYINGVAEGTSTQTATVTGTANNWWIGTAGDSIATGYFDGFISNVRVVKGTAVYTSNFTPGTSLLTDVSGTSLLTCQSNRFIDTSSNDHTITVNGDPKVSALNPFGQESEYAVGENEGSTYFATSGSTSSSGGTGQYAQSELTSTLTLDTNDFTVECWFYALGKIREYPRLIQIGPQNTPWGSDQFAILYKHDSDNDSITVAMQDIGVNALLMASGPIKDNVWYHVAVTRSGSTFTLYINGESVDTYTSSGSATGTGDKALIVGSSTAGDSDFYGYISDVKVSNGTVVYTTNFTPPTAPIGNTNASLYLPMDNAGIFDKTGNHTLTPVSDASTSTTQTKFADTAMAFDGSGDYIEMNNSDGSPNLYTVEFWTYIAGNVASDPTMRFFSSNTGGNVSDNLQISIGWRTLNGAYTNAIFVYTNSVVLADTVDIIDSNWHHVAVTRDSNGDERLFVDGQLKDTYSGGVNRLFENSLIGTRDQSTGTSNFNGYIENLQVLKGVAKYTANFTPPNRTQGITYQAES